MQDMLIFNCSRRIQEIFLEHLEGIGLIMEQQILEALSKDIKVEVRSVCCPYQPSSIPLTLIRESSSLAASPGLSPSADI